MTKTSQLIFISLVILSTIEHSSALTLIPKDVLGDLTGNAFDGWNIGTSTCSGETVLGGPRNNWTGTISKTFELEQEIDSITVQLNYRVIQTKPCSTTAGCSVFKLKVNSDDWANVIPQIQHKIPFDGCQNGKNSYYRITYRGKFPKTNKITIQVKPTLENDFDFLGIYDLNASHGNMLYFILIVAACVLVCVISGVYITIRVITRKSVLKVKDIKKENEENNADNHSTQQSIDEQQLEQQQQVEV